MKRILVVAGLVAAATFLPATAAQADHLCVYSHGQPVACAPHPEEWFTIEEICVTVGGRPLVCVP